VSKPSAIDRVGLARTASKQSASSDPSSGLVISDVTVISPERAAPSPRGQAVTSINPGWPKAVNLSQNVSRLRSTICYISRLTQNWT